MEHALSTSSSVCESSNITQSSGSTSAVGEIGGQDGQVSTTSSADSQAAAVKKKAAKPSVLPTFLPPCRVCNAKASGFHYGVNTCEACKAFFRRSIGHEEAIKPCTSDGKCAENPSGKISCAECRHKKCLQLGMARKDCRKGRYTHKQRTQHTQEFRKIQAEKEALRQSEADQTEHQQMARVLSELFDRCFADIYYFVAQRKTILERVDKLVHEHNVTPPLSRPLFSLGSNSKLKDWASKFTSLLENPDGRQQAAKSMMESWYSNFEKYYGAIAAFAKQIPGYLNLAIDDRIILLKTGGLDAIYCLRHQMVFPKLDAVVRYNSEDDDIFLLPVSLIRAAAGSVFVDGMRRVASRLQNLKLTDEDIPVLLAFVLCSPHRDGLKCRSDVEKIQSKLLAVLQYTLKKNHPDQPNIIADTLLLLPGMEESSESTTSERFQSMRLWLDQQQFPIVHEMNQD